MAFNNIYEELSLWEKLEFPEGHLWRQDNYEEKLLDEQILWNNDVFELTTKGTISTETSHIPEDNLSNKEDSLADWFDETNDFAQIDELVNSPEFHQALLESSDDSMLILNDIDVIPFQPEKDFIINSSSSISEESLNVDHLSPAFVQSYTDIDDLNESSKSNTTYFSGFSSSSQEFPPSVNTNHSVTNPLDKQESTTHCGTSALSKKQLDHDSDARHLHFVSTNSKGRKRCQNRNAAERYRNKKKLEFEILGEEETTLSKNNTKLINKTGKLESEICYLKGLMKELLIAKGLLKK